MNVNAGKSQQFFYGLAPRWLTGNRLYRVYVSNHMLAAAYVAGQVYDEHSATTQLQAMDLLLPMLVRRIAARRKKREALYDSLDPFGPSLLTNDRRNLQIFRSDVLRTRFRRGRSLFWAPQSVGSLELELLAGGKRRFILVGDQKADAVLELLRIFDPAIEVTGKAPPVPPSQAL